MEILKKGSRGQAVKELQRYLNLYPDGIFGEITLEAVLAYQRLHRLTPDGIVGPKTWESLVTTTSVGKESRQESVDGFRVLPTIKKSRRTIKEIIVHCTATPEGKDYTVKDIRNWHKDKGWSDIGYHYVVYRNGDVLVGRDVDIVGAHAGPKNNTYSIGIVYVGGLENIPGVPVAKLPIKDTRTKEQKESLVTLLKKLRKLYPHARIIGHREGIPRMRKAVRHTREPHQRVLPLGGWRPVLRGREGTGLHDPETEKALRTAERRGGACTVLHGRMLFGGCDILPRFPRGGIAECVRRGMQA